MFSCSTHVHHPKKAAIIPESLTDKTLHITAVASSSMTLMCLMLSGHLWRVGVIGSALLWFDSIRAPSLCLVLLVLNHSRMMRYEGAEPGWSCDLIGRSDLVLVAVYLAHYMNKTWSGVPLLTYTVYMHNWTLHYFSFIFFIFFYYFVTSYIISYRISHRIVSYHLISHHIISYIIIYHIIYII